MFMVSSRRTFQILKENVSGTLEQCGKKLLKPWALRLCPSRPAETADAMGKGIVDGATFPFEATIPFDLAPVSEYTLTPGIAGATFSVIIGDHAYLRLSDEHKALIDETTGLTELQTSAHFGIKEKCVDEPIWKRVA